MDNRRVNSLLQNMGNRIAAKEQQSEVIVEDAEYDNNPQDFSNSAEINLSQPDDAPVIEEKMSSQKTPVISKRAKFLSATMGNMIAAKSSLFSHETAQEKTQHSSADYFNQQTNNGIHSASSERLFTGKEKIERMQRMLQERQNLQQAKS